MTLDQAVETIRANGIPDGVLVEADPEIGGVLVSKGGWGFFISPQSIEQGYYLTAFKQTLPRLIELHMESPAGPPAA